MKNMKIVAAGLGFIPHAAPVRGGRVWNEKAFSQAALIDIFGEDRYMLARCRHGTKSAQLNLPLVGEGAGKELAAVKPEYRGAGRRPMPNRWHDLSCLSFRVVG